MAEQFIIKNTIRNEFAAFKDPFGSKTSELNAAQQEVDKVQPFTKVEPKAPKEPEKPKSSEEAQYTGDHEALQEWTNYYNAQAEYQLSLDQYEKEHAKWEKEKSEWERNMAPKKAKVEQLRKNIQPNEHFSFRNSGSKKLYIFPPFLCNDLVGTSFNDDISNQQLYGFSKNGTNTNSIDLTTDILANIPAVDLREYQPDYKVDQVINLMQKFAEGYQAATQTSTSKGDATESVKAKFKKIASKVPNMFEGFWKDVQDVLGIATQIVNNLGNPPKSNGYADSLAIFTIPVIFYYKLMGYTTTNYYTIPFSGSYDINQSDGKAGWKGMNEFSIKNEMPGGQIVGKILSGFVDNIKINRNPKWEPGNGFQQGLQYQISFSLYNNSIEAAINNFIFINTIIPHNLSYQYGLIHQSPCLYDVKIEGGPRMFCCSGSFNCTYKGVLRSMPQAFIHELIEKYGKQLNQESDAISKNLIKIPDVYNIQCTFQSLLPNNFNEYVWRFAQPGMEGPGQKYGHTDDVYTKLMQNAAEVIGNLIK